jgi:precorrin-6B methylase 2
MMQLYVGGLALEVDDKALYGLLEDFSGIELIEIVRELETGKSAGYAIVQLADESVQKTLGDLNGKTLFGKVIDTRRMPLTLPGEMPVREYLLTHAVLVLAKAGLRQGFKVVDYGCGPGVYSIGAAQIVGDNGKVYAVDSRERPLERVREKAAAANLHNIETIKQARDEIKIPGEDVSIDAVIIYDVLHDINDITGLLREASRVLKPHGLLTAFPMHWGNEPFLKLMKQVDLFEFREAFIPPNSKSPSHILNFVKK